MTSQRQTTSTSKNDTYRFYGYTKNKSNANWIEKNAKKFESKAQFLDALITKARKEKITVAIPTVKKTIAKKAAKKSIVK